MANPEHVAKLREGVEPSKLNQTNLGMASLAGALLVEADLHHASLMWTVFGATDLTGAKGLDTCLQFKPEYPRLLNACQIWPARAGVSTRLWSSREPRK